MADIIDIQETSVDVNDGQFSTSYRYMQTAAHGTVAALLQGPSIAFNTATSGISSVIAWRYEVASYVVNGDDSTTAAPTPTDVDNTPTEIVL